MRSKQKARLRHVPITRRVAAWIAAVAHDAHTSQNFVIGFAVLHAVLWTMILTALKSAQDVHMDVAEAFAWGQKFLLGYGKHPPLAGWIATRAGRAAAKRNPGVAGALMMLMTFAVFEPPAPPKAERVLKNEEGAGDPPET